MRDNKLKPNDAIGLAFANYHYKNKTSPPINHNIAPTLTTDGEMAIVERSR